MSASDFVVCIFTGFSEYEVTFAYMFMGFAESRLWKCRVFSLTIACASQKSRVFPFTFADGPCKSNVLHTNLLICMILCICGVLGGRQFLRRVEVCMQFSDVF